jgi:hypothetical protein
VTGRRAERPGRGNKYKLTYSQHVFPKASIARFANDKGLVSVCDMIRGRTRPASPKDAIFCAARAWSQREEGGFMRDIEAEFQRVVRKIIDETASTLESSDHRAISNFFALWYFRARQRTLPMQEIQGKGITGGAWTPDQQEMLESRGIVFVRPGGKLLARQINGAQIQMKVGIYANDALASVEWGIVHAQEGEFLVPDVPDHMIVPITPTICLVSNQQSGWIVRSTVAEINRTLQAASREYFFARNFAKCPR